MVASGQASVSVSNIAVCSVDDGYWVAWLPEGAELPVLAYVDRGTVTGIASFEEPVGIPVILHPSQNPFRESVNLTVEGNPLPERLDVFDITGRLIRVLEFDSVSSTFLWDGRNISKNWHWIPGFRKLLPQAINYTIVSHIVFAVSANFV